MSGENKTNPIQGTQQVNSPMAGGIGSIGGMHRAFGGQPKVRAKNTKETLKRLWYYFGNEQKMLVAIFIFTSLSAVVGLMGPFLIGKGIDVLQNGHDYFDQNALLVIGGILLLVYLADSIMNFLQGWFMAGISQRVVLRLRKVLYDKLQKLPVSFFDTRTHGELMSRLANDVDNISSTIASSVTLLMAGVIMIIGSLIMMIILSPILTLASSITIPLMFLLTKTVTKKTRPLFKEQQVSLGKLNGIIEETISGAHVVKAFNQEELVIEKFTKVNEQLLKIGVKAQVWSGFLMPLMNVINNIGFVAVAYVGGYLAYKDLISIGLIASFISYSKQFTRPLIVISNIFNTLQTAIAGAERVFEILDEKEELEDVVGAKVLENPEGHVVFKNVSFGYNEDKVILSDVNFSVPQGSTVALVGPTGAGKTTVVNLLTRFYDVSKGQIEIDGVDIRNYLRDSLRECFGIVLQDTYLFSGTIKENILYGKPDATDEEVISAAKLSNAHSFITHLPKGYNTLLVESGRNLSQGEKQLLAITRAILSKHSILILDEATSSVDTRTEMHIQEAMIKLMEGKTCFVIAHRLSTIRDADIIVVIDGGEIVESGSHEELLLKDGLYKEMYQSSIA